MMGAEPMTGHDPFGWPDHFLAAKPDNLTVAICLAVLIAILVVIILVGRR